jgi:hypothetical protein
MISESQLADFLQFAVVALFMIVVIFKILPAVRLDAFRQEMFEIRDELFDLAADGQISFQHPAYILLRRQMNGFIRHGHQLTAFRMLMSVIIHKISGEQDPSRWHTEWDNALTSTDNEHVRRQLERIHHKGMRLATMRLLLGSPILWIMMLIFMAQIMFQGAAKGVRQLLKAASRKALNGPINYRSIEDVAQGQFA